MALARNRRRERGIDYWPGFVDALSTLLLAIMFLLSVFVLAQFLLSQEITGKDEVLNRLNSQINELTRLLSLEQSNSQDLNDQLANLQASLQEAETEKSRLEQLLASGAGAAGELAVDVDVDGDGSGVGVDGPAAHGDGARSGGDGVDVAERRAGRLLHLHRTAGVGGAGLAAGVPERDVDPPGPHVVLAGQPPEHVHAVHDVDRPDERAVEPRAVGVGVDRGRRARFPRRVTETDVERTRRLVVLGEAHVVHPERPDPGVLVGVDPEHVDRAGPAAPGAALSRGGQR